MRNVNRISQDARVCKQANLRIFQGTLNRVFKDLPHMNPEELFTVEFRGYRFNALPFLFNGACYYNQSHYEMLFKHLVKEFPIRKGYSLQEFYRNKLLDAKVFEALLPGTHGRREFWAMMFCKCQDETIRLLYQGACRVLNQTIIYGDFCHINYKCKDICNTQAFCFYLTVWWLVNLSPLLRKQIEPNLRKHNFEELLYSLCPETSIHFKYIKGEISANELVHRYDTHRMKDGSTVAVREAYSNCSKGNYDGSPMTKEQWSIGREEVDFLMLGGEQELNKMIGYAYLCGGTYDTLKREVDSAMSVRQQAIDAEQRAKQRYRTAAEQCSKLRKEKQELQSEVAQLRGEIARFVTNEELLKQISELAGDLREARRENDSLFDERLALKQELSARVKEIKQLRARLEAQGVEDFVLEDSSEGVTIEEMVSALKDKRIVMVGGDRSKSLAKTFEDWGFKSFVNMSGNVRKADCDFLVICSVLCSHSDMYQAERMIRGQDTIQVYVNGVNAEMILRALWEAQG